MTEAEWLVSNHPTPMVLHIVETVGYKKLARLVLAFHKINRIEDVCPNDTEVEQLLDGTHLTKAFPWGDCKNLVVGCAWACTDGRDNGKLGADAVRDIIGNPFRSVELPEGPRNCDYCGGTGSYWGYYGLDDDYEKMECCRCDGRGWFADGPCPWLTPAVLSLAHAAHNISCRGCDQCYDGWLPGECIRPCPNRTNATLDPSRLVVLADALEEVGCEQEECGKCPVLRKAKIISDGSYDRDMVEEVIKWGRAKKQCRCGGTGKVPHPILSHLRSPGPHWRGCWAVDLILGVANSRPY